MSYYYRRKIDEYSDKIYDSCFQITEYMKKEHVMNPQYLQKLHDNISTVDIVKNTAELENTANILDEIKSILLVEEKRRRVQSQLNEKLEKGCVKKSRMEERQKRLKERANPYTRFLRSFKALPSSQELEEPTISHQKSVNLFFLSNV